ncbi:AmmeMemoRadiSam system protein B [Patescibacteria group bacterium]|nr:AmmeMemoRadiSam system protein B [Patescibacteria group bacterium]
MKQLLTGACLFIFITLCLALTKIAPHESKPLLLESPYTNSSLYEKEFVSAINTTEQEISAGIVSHHLLASNLIANFFKGIKSENIKNVIIVGPDHFDYLTTHNTLAASSFIPWKTPFGELLPKESLIKILHDQNLVNILDTAFRTEHSIYTLVPFVKYAFPQVKVTPIILNNREPIDSFYSLGQKVSQILNQDNTILIVSSDFSHNVTVNNALSADKNSIQLLMKLNMDTIENIESDCQACMAFLSGYLNSSEPIFQLLDNKTSNDFSDQSQDTVTSYVTGYFLKSHIQNHNIKLLFTGDFLFDRYIRQVVQNKGQDFILDKITSFLNNFDSVIINLESPITTNKSISIDSIIGTPDNFTFTSPPSVTQVLNDNNISIVNLGNNHILNFEHEGLSQTIDILKSAQIEYFGNINSLLNPSFLLKEINGVKIGFVNYNQFSSNNLESTLEDIEEIKPKVNLIILYAHWGFEYTNQANYKIQDLAHQFIDSGVDLIIGSHPHVIQQNEIYNDKYIYYSLGNFVFDQYFREETQKGLLVEVDIDSQTHAISVKDHFVNLQTNGQTSLAK